MQSRRRKMPLTTKQSVARLVLLVVYWSVLFWGTHRTFTHPPVIKLSDKLVHVIAYTGLGVLLSLTITAFWPQTSVSRTALLIIMSYGILDELTQLFVGRKAEIADWCADVLGGVIGIYLIVPIITGRVKTD